jgi:hypothetical protein
MFLFVKRAKTGQADFSAGLDGGGGWSRHHLPLFVFKEYGECSAIFA